MLFSNVIGQVNVKNNLINTVLRSRVSHAQLFLGPEGSGKLPLAIAYAQFLNCTNRRVFAEGPLAGDSCGTCPSCIKYEKLIHPDLHFIYPVATTKDVPKNPVSKRFAEKWRHLLTSRTYYVNLIDWYNEIGIEKKQGIINTEDCSEILRTLSYTSYESEYKVMILWMVEKLFHAAAPKILKILEEPPDKTLFILIAESQDQIIKTILSRTQLVRVPPIDEESLAGAMQERFPGHSQKFGDIISVSGGNFREAMRMMGEEQEDKELFETFRQWMRLCFQKNIASLNEFISPVAARGREWQKQFLLYGLKIIRESALTSNNLGSIVRLRGEEKLFVSKFAPYITSNNIVGLNDLFNDALTRIERNANASLLFTDLSIRIAALLKNA